MTREQKIRWDNYAVHQYAVEEGHMDGHAIVFSDMVKIAHLLRNNGYHENFIIECTQLSSEHITELLKMHPISGRRPSNYLNDSDTFGLNTVRIKERNEVLKQAQARKIEIARKLKATRMGDSRIAECTGLSLRRVDQLLPLYSNEPINEPKTDQQLKWDSQFAFDYAREQGRNAERRNAECEKRQLLMIMARELKDRGVSIDIISEASRLSVETIKLYLD